MAQILSVANQKGGVGKTTTAINLAAGLALHEMKVLLVDLDPQGNATSGMGVQLAPDAPSVYEVMIGGASPEEAVIRGVFKEEMPSLDLIPAGIKLVGAEIELVSMVAREHALQRHLKSFAEEYDYVLIDSPPSLGLLTLNGLSAATSVLIPIQCEYYALEGLSQLLNTIRLVQKNLNPSLQILGGVLTMYDHRLNLSRQVAEELRTYFHGRVFDSVIYRNVRLSEAPSYGMPILLYDVTSRGAENYLSLAGELLQHDTTT